MTAARQAWRMSPLLMEGDIRAPEVWLRVNIHDRRASPIGVPRTPAQVLDGLLGVPAPLWNPTWRRRHPGVATLKVRRLDLNREWRFCRPPCLHLHCAFSLMFWSVRPPYEPDRYP